MEGRESGFGINDLGYLDLSAARVSKGCCLREREREEKQGGIDHGGERTRDRDRERVLGVSVYFSFLSPGLYGNASTKHKAKVSETQSPW